MLEVQQHSNVRRLLLATEHRELVYVEQEEMFLSGGKVKGRNELGKVLMRARLAHWHEEQYYLFMAIVEMPTQFRCNGNG
jgi:predicted NAD-dependent protein-ADP-ribosyltransferase YbiA (DUF1768 family)